MSSPPVLRPDKAGLTACAQALTAGQLVAFPTETVYGLGADATNPEAVVRVFEAKARPRFNPLIIHAASLEDAARLGRLEGAALRLAKSLWPGALTLVAPRLPSCPVASLACAGLETIALRVPSHPVANALIRAANLPLAAPSANPSGKISPTRAAHVAAAMMKTGSLACILDGGPASLGLESTIVGFAPDETPLLLRPGAIAREEVEAILNQPLATGPAEPETAARLAPGRLIRHYAPDTPLRLNAQTLAPGELLLAFGPRPLPGDAPRLNLSPSGDLHEAAARLFDCLHTLDAMAHTQANEQSSPPVIAVMPIPGHGLGEAINDRLERAAAHHQDR